MTTVKTRIATAATAATTATNNSTMIAVATLLREYSEELSEAWLERPFSRVDLALAFAAGFAKSETDDIHPVASLVLKAAYMDKDERALRASIQRVEVELSRQSVE